MNSRSGGAPLPYLCALLEDFFLEFFKPLRHPASRFSDLAGYFERRESATDRESQIRHGPAAFGESRCESTLVGIGAVEGWIAFNRESRVVASDGFMICAKGLTCDECLAKEGAPTSVTARP